METVISSETEVSSLRGNRTDSAIELPYGELRPKMSAESVVGA